MYLNKSDFKINENKKIIHDTIFLANKCSLGKDKRSFKTHTHTHMHICILKIPL